MLCIEIALAFITFLNSKSFMIFPVQLHPHEALITYCICCINLLKSRA